MATILPELSDEQLKALRSSAEAAFYRACRDALPDRFLVLYSVQTLWRGDRVYEGEADFVILDPQNGLLVVEVKGGGIAHDPRTGGWTSRDFAGVVHPTKDPFGQAAQRKHDILKLLSATTRWANAVAGPIPAGHAVCFPDLTEAQVRGIRLPAGPAAIVTGHGAIEDISSWVSALFGYYRAPNQVSLGAAGVEVARHLLRPAIDVQPLLGARLRAEESQRVRLTENQALILEIVRDRKRVAISGGAGTGKTLLAVHDARRRARAGENVLLLCFNRPLADHLKHVMTDSPGVNVVSLHQFYEWWVTHASKVVGRNLVTAAESEYPGRSRTDVVLPQACMVALDEVGGPDARTIIVDEGQDFGDEDWLVIDTLAEKCGAALLIFHDHNQELYRRGSCFPITDERDQFPLRRNCRNTAPIHAATYRFYEGPPTEAPPIPGELIRTLAAPTLAAQARKITDEVARLLREDVPAAEIAVLILGADAWKKEHVDALLPHPPMGAAWSAGTYGVAGTVLVDSASRFKGLEAAVVILWVGSDPDPVVHRELLYVGMSRARSRLVVVGSAEACRRALEGG